MAKKKPDEKQPEEIAQVITAQVSPADEAGASPASGEGDAPDPVAPATLAPPDPVVPVEPFESTEGTSFAYDGPPITTRVVTLRGGPADGRYLVAAIPLELTAWVDRNGQRHTYHLSDRTRGSYIHARSQPAPPATA